MLYLVFPTPLEVNRNRGTVLLNGVCPGATANYISVSKKDYKHNIAWLLQSLEFLGYHMVSKSKSETEARSWRIKERH